MSKEEQIRCANCPAVPSAKVVGTVKSMLLNGRIIVVWFCSRACEQQYNEDTKFEESPFWRDAK